MFDQPKPSSGLYQSLLQAGQRLQAMSLATTRPLDQRKSVTTAASNRSALCFIRLARSAAQEAAELAAEGHFVFL
jgi:hypothetical protein